MPEIVSFLIALQVACADSVAGYTGPSGAAGTFREACVRLRLGMVPTGRLL